jgi:hypothetical protein
MVLGDCNPLQPVPNEICGVRPAGLSFFLSADGRMEIIENERQPSREVHQWATL